MFIQQVKFASAIKLFPQTLGKLMPSFGEHPLIMILAITNAGTETVIIGGMRGAVIIFPQDGTI